jgi:hypothetical protein
VKKAEDKWWSRFLKQQGRPPIFLKVDWDKWVDEDEEPEKKRECFFHLYFRYFVVHAVEISWQNFN